MIGSTRDDAAGECFDKVAKMLGLGFPGGAKVAKLSDEYTKAHLDDIDSRKPLFPEVLLERDSLDFSFSWLKSAVKRVIDKEILDTWSLSPGFIQYICYEFEETATDILSKKLHRAVEQTGVKMMMLAGWVSANTLLREKLHTLAERIGIEFLAPTKIVYSMDNAAMIWIRAYYEYIKKHKSD